MNRKVLIVDDDKDILIVLKAALEDSGYKVVTAMSAQEALDRVEEYAAKYNNSSLKELEFPVILLDIMMPKINGLEFLHIIRNKYPDTIVIMLTAHISVESAIRSLNEGAFAYLVKPFNISEMRQIIRNAFEKYELILENRRLVEELYAAKKYSETIIHDMIHTIIATDNNGLIRKVNKATEDLLGYKEEEIIGNPLEFIFAPEYINISWQELIKKGKVREFPMIFLAKNKQRVKVSFTGTVLKDENGEIIGFLGMIKK